MSTKLDMVEIAREVLGVPADKYYAANFPPRLFVHRADGIVSVSTSDSAAEFTAVIAEFAEGSQQADFAAELIRRWNHSPKREQALMDIREMAGKRRSAIRMPNGMMLDTFCGQALLEEKP